MKSVSDFALMFWAQEGGSLSHIKWGKENLTDDRSILVLDESSLAIWLWHGKKQGLVARRTALRQAQSLKGHGYTIGKSIIGREIREIKEIDQRKIGRDPETDNIYTEFQNVLKRNYQELDNFVITFSAGGYDPRLAKPEPKPVVIPEAIKSVDIPPTPSVKPETKASEYEEKEPLRLEKPIVKPTVPVETPAAAAESPIEEARAAFIIKAVLNHYDDVWVSKKKDGSYAVEMMDGPVCQFSIQEGTIKFTANSFSNISPSVKTAIQKKYVELNRLL